MTRKFLSGVRTIVARTHANTHAVGFRQLPDSLYSRLLALSGCSCSPWLGPARYNSADIRSRLHVYDSKHQRHCWELPSAAAPLGYLGQISHVIPRAPLMRKSRLPHSLVAIAHPLFGGGEVLPLVRETFKHCSF